MPGETTTQTTTPPAGTTPPPAAPAPATAPPTTTLLTAPAQDPKTTPPAGTTPPPAGTQPPPAAADIELKLPDGYDPKDPALADFKTVAKELGLKSEQAQKIADLYVKSQEPLRAELARQAAEKATWESAIKKDPEIGGAKYAESLELARRAVVKFGGAELKQVDQLLEESGLGNHPAFVKLFARIGRGLGEDTVSGGVGSTPANPNDWAKVAFPNSPDLHK